LNIKLTAVGKFQRYFPARTCELDFPGISLSEFLVWVKEEYGFEAESYRNLKITRNFTLVRDQTITLAVGDRIGFIPIVAGG